MLNHLTMPAVAAESDQLGAELDAWDDTIRTLDDALRAAFLARLEIEEEQVVLERIEASHVLRIEGGNAETRKARLTLELADDERYLARQQALQTARHQLWEAERTIAVTKERLRLIQANVGSYFERRV